MRHILEYYKKKYNVNNIDLVEHELKKYDCTVNKDAFICKPVYNEDFDGYLFFAGYKGEPSFWFLREFLKVIKEKDRVVTTFQGKKEVIEKYLHRYNPIQIGEINGSLIYTFDKKGEK